MSVEFIDNSAKIIQLLEEAATAGLEEAAAELESQAIKNTPVDKGQLKGAWGHVIDEKNMVATIGNTLENAIWTELGTGEYALEGKGRKGYWVYVKGSEPAKGKKSKKSKRVRTLEEAKKTVAILRSKGIEAYYTNGKKPIRMLHNAFVTKKNTVIRIMGRHYREKLK